MSHHPASEEETAPLIGDNEQAGFENGETRHDTAVDDQDNATSKKSTAFKILSYFALPLSSVGIYLTPLHFAIVAITFLPTFTCMILFASMDNTPTDPAYRAVNLKTLLITSLFTGTLGMTVMSIISAILCFAFALPLLGSHTMEYMTEGSRAEDTLGTLTEVEIQRRAWLASRWQYWVYMVLLTFVGAALLEEVLKYTCLMISKTYFVPYFSSQSSPSSASAYYDNTRSTPAPESKLMLSPTSSTGEPRILTEKSYIFIMIAVALGFSCVESLGFLYVALHKAHESGSKLLLSLAERTFLAAPMHTLCSVLVAINTIRRARHDMAYQDLWQILLVPVLVHGAFDFALLATSAWAGNPGWVHPEIGSRALGFLSVVAVGTLFGFGGYVWAEWALLGELR